MQLIIYAGFTNEPALRGGYMEILNIDRSIRDILVQLLSVQQCPNIMGQVSTNFTNLYNRLNLFCMALGWSFRNGESANF